MKTMNRTIMASVVGLALSCGSTAYAACQQPQVAGVWEAAFSDGNSCRLVVKTNGTFNVNASVCYDPDRGAGAPDSGHLKIDRNCFSEGEIVLQGTVVELPVQFSSDRAMAAGRFRVTANGFKGSVVMVRVP